MSASYSSSSHSFLLDLPLEIREDVYSNLLLPQHVYTSSPTPNTHTLHRSNKTPPTYVDTRIYVPARFPTNIVQTCRQLREECMNFHARQLNSLLPATMVDYRPPEETSSNQLAARNNTSLEERTERVFDEDVVRVTLEILRGVRGTMGFYVPERKDLSPRFMGLAPLLSTLKKVKFTVWAGYDWWSGNSTRPIATGKRTQKARFNRTSPDQDDQLQQPSELEDDGTTSSPTPRPDRLYVAISTVLRHLPLVEEVNVDVILHVMDFWNWDLPEEGKWEGIRGWLDGPVCSATEGTLKRVHRRFIVVHPGGTSGPTRRAIVLRQLELRQTGENAVRVERGINELPPDWDGSDNDVPEPPFTETFGRSE